MQHVRAEGGVSRWLCETCNRMRERAEKLEKACRAFSDTRKKATRSQQRSRTSCDLVGVAYVKSFPSTFCEVPLQLDDLENKEKS